MEDIIYEGRVGDILICRGRSWLSRMIMRITKGTWSHTALYSEVWGQKGIIEAQKNGVNFKLWEVWQHKWGYKFSAWRYNGPIDERAIMLRAFEKCGETKYDFWTFIRRAFGGRKARDKRREEKRMICSEFTAYVYRFPEGYDMTPQEQYDYLVDSPEWEQIF